MLAQYFPARLSLFNLVWTSAYQVEEGREIAFV